MNREKPERRRQLSHWRKHRERGRGTRELWTLLITLYFALRIWEVPGEEEGEREGEEEEEPTERQVCQSSLLILFVNKPSDYSCD